MRRSFSRAGLAALAPALAALLTGCTHIGTNVAGNFSCRGLKAGCEPLSEVDARAIRQLVTAEQADFAIVRQRIGLAAADNARTGERTMRVIFPAHIDGSGTLHEEAVAWTVVEAARWAGELRLREVIKPRGPVHALRQALEDQARRINDRLRATEALPTSTCASAGAAATAAAIARKARRACQGPMESSQREHMRE